MISVHSLMQVHSHLSQCTSTIQVIRVHSHDLSALSDASALSSILVHSHDPSALKCNLVHSHNPSTLSDIALHYHDPRARCMRVLIPYFASLENRPDGAILCDYEDWKLPLFFTEVHSSRYSACHCSMGGISPQLTRTFPCYILILSILLVLISVVGTLCTSVQRPW